MNLLVLITTLILENTTTKFDLKIQQETLEPAKIPEKNWLEDPEVRFQERWQQYKINFNKFYRNDEEEYKGMRTFLKNSELIEAHNQLYNRGLSTYELGHNHLSDLTHEEFLNQYISLDESIKIPKETADPTSYSPTARYNPTLGYNPTVQYEHEPTVRYDPTVRHDPTVRNNPTLGYNPTVQYEHEPTVRYGQYDAAKETQKNSIDNDYGEYMPPANVDLPITVDWRRAGAVTRVKNQGKCKASWLFSATGALEGQVFRKTRNLTSLSEQNILDCSETYGYKGCKNGSILASFQYIIRNQGIDTDATYPWEEKQSWFCHYQNRSSNPKIRSIEKITSGYEFGLQAAVATVGPISVGFDASNKKFQFYKNGLYRDPNCTTYNLNHNMLVVGYRQNYYVVKNSFGRDWGSSGYIFIPKGAGNACGIATRAMYPKL